MYIQTHIHTYDKTHNTKQHETTQKHTTTRPPEMVYVSVHQAASVASKGASKDNINRHLPKTIGVWYCFKLCFCNCAPDPEIIVCLCTKPLGNQAARNQNNITRKHTCENAGALSAKTRKTKTRNDKQTAINIQTHRCCCLKGGEQRQHSQTIPNTLGL